MSKGEKSIETMADDIRRGEYDDFGKLLNLCAYIPKEIFTEAVKFGYEKEDIYQESVIAFLHALKSFDKNSGAGFRTYASACIKNHVVSLIRSGNRVKSRAMIDYIPIDDIDIMSEKGPESEWIEKEAFYEIKKRIANVLSDFEFEVLKLYLAGYSYRKIGEKLCKTEKSVSNALSRIRRKLRSSGALEK